MPRSSAQFRNTVLKKLLPPESRSALSVARERMLAAHIIKDRVYAASPMGGAFRTRGNGGARTSYNMEDIIAVLDGRPGIEQEINTTSVVVRSFVTREFHHLEGDTNFQDAIQEYLSDSPSSATRRENILSRIATIVQDSAS